MPTYPHIEQYYADKQRLIEFAGSDREQNIRRAFENCLDAYCRDRRESLALIAELPTRTGVKPDGTVLDFLRLPRGYWEAKDSRDDLYAEIQRKFGRGYPKDNILFEDSRIAVLFQRGAVAMQVDMSSPADLHRLIEAFLNYVTREVEDFRRAWQQFKEDIPTILSKLREDVANAAQTNSLFRTSADSFLELCRRTISADVTEFDVQEMLIQHTLTKDIFLRVFSEDQFHQENNIARQLDALERSFMTGDLRRETIGRLLPYYTAITAAAVAVADYHEKQQFLKAIYEDFYKAYNPAAADRLGVVYTPNEVVDFIIRGADHLLRKHFNRSLSDDNVQILDPATGTGTFITSLIDYLPADWLEYKYLNEIHANEVAILPYYVANLNIEYTYRERTGRYLEFPNLVFVDTLDNMAWQGATGGTVERQAAFNLGGLSEENWLRVQEQNEKTISVIIGNPPYNDKQANWYELNPNREYTEIDQRIKDTYVREGTAQRTHQYDMYKRFIRWASDRLADNGIIAFITNRAYLDARQDDGFRKVAAEEFTDIYVLDLGSDVRRNPKISGTTHNVFGIQTGVAIGFFVRDKSKGGECSLYYAHREDAELATHKLAYLREAKMGEIAFEDITPDSKSNWLNQSNSDFEKLLPLVNRETKLAQTANEEKAVFHLFSNGINTNRDEWLFDFDEEAVAEKVQFFSRIYGDEMRRFELEPPENTPIRDWVDKSIKWTSELEAHFAKGDAIDFSFDNIVPAMYRPFISKHSYYAPIITHRTYQQPRIFPFQGTIRNRVVCFSGLGTRKPFDALATDRLVERQLLGNMQCIPFYRYTENGERVSNITQWGINRINDHYKNEWSEDFGNTYPNGITAEHIFAYTYAVLHDPVYRHKYAVDLTREFPRLPLYHDFDKWADMGQELLDLHIGFETAEPYPLKRVDGTRPPGRPVLRADKAGGRIVLDDKTTLTGVPSEAWRYQLGNRSALEWVLDQYKEKKPRDPTIAEKFNTYRFADYKEQVIDLLKRVCTVSVRTMQIVDSMAYWDDEGKLVALGNLDKRA